MRLPLVLLRKTHLVHMRLVSALNAMEHRCHGNECNGNENESPILYVNVVRANTAPAAVSDRGVLAIWPYAWLPVCQLMQKLGGHRR